MRRLAFVLLMLWLAPAAWAQAPALVSIKTPRGASQAFILIKPDKPVAAVILFAGGHGALGLKSATAMAWGAQNFLVRSREKFAGQLHGRGGRCAVRPGRRHERDLPHERRAHGRHRGGRGLSQEGSRRAVWLVGTSMGTFSSAAAAIAGKDVDGLVLTSTITRVKPDWKIAQSHRDGVASMALGQVTVPTLVLFHRKDGCDITPAADAPKLAAKLTKAAKVETVLLDGGSPPQSDPCEARSQHGFLGIETQAVDAIAKFIKANGK